MRDACPTCERPFEGADVFEQDGFKFVFGVGIEFRGREICLKRGQHRVLRMLLSRRFVSFEAMAEEVCRDGTENRHGSVKVQISGLRKALHFVSAPYDIVNRHGMGYSLVRHVA